MKTFEVEYTENFGETFNKVDINANTLTQAYVKALLKVSKEISITNITEKGEQSNECLS